LKIVIYSKDNCPFCDKAIGLAKLKKTELTIKKLGVDFDMQNLLEKFPTARTFPQIVIDGENIGGYTEFSQIIK